MTAAVRRLVWPKKGKPVQNNPPHVPIYDQVFLTLQKLLPRINEQFFVFYTIKNWNDEHPFAFGWNQNFLRKREIRSRCVLISRLKTHVRPVVDFQVHSCEETSVTSTCWQFDRLASRLRRPLPPCSTSRQFPAQLRSLIPGYLCYFGYLLVCYAKQVFQALEFIVSCQKPEHNCIHRVIYCCWVDLTDKVVVFTALLARPCRQQTEIDFVIGERNFRSPSRLQLLFPL